MCGIAAYLGPEIPGEGERMLARMNHRGPDDSGEISLPGGWLGHTRLSIVDLVGGHQPLGGNGGQRWLVGNGEIYNHREVRRSLGNADYQTQSDNEVALRLIEHRGPDALGELEGMYAFLSADTNGGSFIAARDPVGIKPLYWTPPASPGDEVRFASEIAAFDPAWRANVVAFPPGHHWTPERGLQRFSFAVPTGAYGQYWEVWEAEPSKADLIATRDVLVDSVHRQMMGDVPVGVFLSGGLDSSLVAAIAARWCAERGERLPTFAVGLEGSPDLLAARRAAEFLGTEHHERTYTDAEALEVLPQVVRAIEHFDPSLVRSAVPNFLLAEMASEKVKVVLTGEGADELFAGYEYFHDEFTDTDQMQQELMASLNGLHNLNLQRCDRVTMAHSLEARVPFLDSEVIEHAMGLPAAWKVASRGMPEKRLLRKAFAGWLPEDLLWRTKAQFGDGSGAASVLTEAIESQISEAEFVAEAARVDPPLRTREELAYYRIWSEHLGGVRPERTLSRFATA
ncbi:MAG: asparagine synthase (glutamine-hydrolyzing) [Solirubrobacterales bacterium]|nr:asparagine synthase (glutamine-hydrolyzing) [Solirubrobacterales bacterium]